MKLVVVEILEVDLYLVPVLAQSAVVDYLEQTDDVLLRQLVNLMEKLLSFSETDFFGQGARLVRLYRVGRLLLFPDLHLFLLLLRRYREISLHDLLLFRGKTVIIYLFLIFLQGLQVERLEILSYGQVVRFILVE